MTYDPRILRPPLWYKDAIIYELHVRAFSDSNDDGIGDFQGLTSRLDYLSHLGVDTIWLLPFYPSPLRDDGYDIAEYFDVHPSYGTLDDFKAFLEAAHARNMRVITELVINHTSDQHSWFQRARRAEPGSPERDFYVWSDTADRFSEVRIIFSDTETSNWTWDSVAGAYYWHRFFSHQPDLNYDNELVREAITDVFRFWLDLGVDGLRLDAVPYLFERDGSSGENLPETHQELKRIRAFVDENYENRMLLAEANQWPEDSAAYFGDNDECHMAFHFPLMPRLFLALQLESRLPITDILEQTPPIPPEAQWAIFLRNHDELTLEMVSEEERDLMWRAYSPDRRARLNLGIRRRLAPLLENDNRRIELLFSLLLSLPGTPVIYYGDEIGMGDNIFLADRDGVRTPMQWSNDRNAGFSRANSQSLYLPVVVDPQFHYETVNVEAQQANPNSMLWWVRNMIRLRQRHPVFGRGAIEFLSPENEHVFAYLRADEHETILVVANLTRHSQFVELDLSRFAGHHPIEMLGRTEFPEIGTNPYLLTVGPFGFYWFSIDGLGAPLSDVADIVEISGPLEAAFSSDDALAEALGRYVAGQKWYLGTSARRSHTNVLELIPLSVGEQDPSMWLAFVNVAHQAGVGDLYVVPVAISFEPAAPITDSSVIVRVRRDGVDGVMYDGFSDERFRARLLETALAGETLLGASGSMTCSAGLEAVNRTPDRLVGSTVQTNDRGETYLDYGDGITVKIFRRVEPGTNPDLELRRFLTEHTAFENVAETYGALEYQSGDSYTVGIMQQSFAGATSAWDRFGSLSQAWLETVTGHVAPDVPGRASDYFDELKFPLPGQDILQSAVDLASQLGSTTARLHLAFGSFSEDPDLSPQPFTQHYQHSLYQSLRSGVRRDFRALRRLADSAPSDVSAALTELIASETDCLQRLDAVRRHRIMGSRIRLHGDYRLDEIYIVDDEFVIEDFSGDHSRPMTERRLRGSGLSDVAQMLRSFDYVASAPLLGRSPGEHAWAAIWTRQIGQTFLMSYLTDLADSALIPDSPTGTHNLLNAFMVSRALREVHWDLANRPDWVSIPLSGLRRLLQ